MLEPLHISLSITHLPLPACPLPLPVFPILMSHVKGHSEREFDVEREAEATKVTETAGEVSGHRRQASSKCDPRHWQCFKTLEVTVETPFR